MRARTFKQKERKMLVLDEFRGVDFSSSPLNISPYRASSMRNFINEYGVNKKRNGWRELLCIKRSGAVQPINGIFAHPSTDTEDFIVHAGERLYLVTRSEDGRYSYADITLSSTHQPSRCDASLLKSTRSQGFYNKGRLYLIGCGDYLVFGSFDGGETYELRRVADGEDTYIPTTAISIDPDTVTDDRRSTLDDINCLSSRRINQLVGSSTSTSCTWTLDTDIDEGTDVEVKLETIEGEEETAVEYLIKNTGDDKTKLYRVEKNGETIEPFECGSVDFAEGKITLTVSTTPQISERDNIYVTFYHANSDYISRITNCNFGILFGVGGNTDRLFLAGNPRYPNIDFHSEMDDYTYFSDLSTAAMGSDSVPINGYARLSDSTLVIYKAASAHEASIFYRTGTYQTSYDEDGNLQYMRAIFSHSAGAVGEGVVSRFACQNFAGDNIILSKNGVFGVVLGENVATNERYTRERSRTINEKLRRHAGLSEAVAAVFDGRYYLSVDGVCYVADSRYKFVPTDTADNSFCYEWWYWDNMPVRVWGELKDRLYFGTSEGLVCTFDDKYTDRTYQESAAGDLALDVVNGRIEYNGNITLSLSEGDRMEFLTDGIYAIVAEGAIEDGCIRISEDAVNLFYEGMEVYTEASAENSLSASEKYIISYLDAGRCRIRLEDSAGDEPPLISGDVRLYRYISKKELYITDVIREEIGGTFALKEYKEGRVIRPAIYNGTIPTAPIGSFTHIENVVAEWYTPIFDLGTNTDAKSLLKLTVSTEPEVNGKLSFGYETRRVTKLINAKGINVFSFDDFSFENFSFETGFANSYSVRCNERNFNFIIFRFISDNDVNCAVNSFTAVYKINQANKGVM